MSLLTAHNLSKLYGPDEIFSGISVEIPQRARIALVGPNGVGKTTLLNLLTGSDIADTGDVHLARGARIGFLPQRPELHGSNTLYAEQLGAFDALRVMEAELAQLEHALADEMHHDETLAAYGELQERFEMLGGYTYEQRIRTVLHGLGFTPEDYERQLMYFSGGQKTRALLARLLLEAPDLLVLDEPTNHLDIQAIEWLESYLNDFPGAVLVVSHDRYFIDVMAQTIWELDFGALEVYRGNYSHYVRQREERHARRLKEYEAQQAFIAKEEDYIRRNMAGQNTRQAKGRLKRLERLKRDDLVLRPRARHTMHLAFGDTQRSGDKVVMTYDLEVGFPDKPLFEVPDLVLRRGEVAALIGPNGVGKSTFVKTITGVLAPLAGEIKIGAAVTIGYFAQAHESLVETNSILDEIQAAKPMPISQARSYLGQFLFSGDDVFRPINSLSGGERGRVALAKLALSGANLLLLDEPTNHLDIESQEILQNVLAGFPGTLLIVSHDRYLIDALATQIWSATSGEMIVFEGSYREFLDERNRQQSPTEDANSAQNGKNGTAKESGSSGARKQGLNPFELKQRLTQLETEIESLEAQLEDLTTTIERASLDGNAAHVRQLGEEYTRTQTARDAALALWAELAD
ncbi:MAG: ABC-F family ATP-binding cassette domain-containing protein [Anaerolineae bacterium]|nr:ABC-F family ATP-binding cassette domain-containing protein [Anaerolineae bacterium]